jgi:ParB-like chromosome segregation protein Spo0J
MSDYELVPVEQLVEHPANPRRGDVDAIVAAIAANGWHGALLVQRSTRRVLAGNHRLRAARALGMPEVPVLWADVDELTARRILVADNRASDLGAFEAASLAALIAGASGADREGMLFTEADVALLLAPDQDTVQQALSAGARRGAYEARGVRSLVLPYPVADYIRHSDALRALGAAWGAASLAATLDRLITEALAEEGRA